MNIGITYDLKEEYLSNGYTREEVAEFDRNETVDSIEAALNFLGHSTDRIGNVKSLIKRITDGYRWDLVFNICEGLKGFNREAQVPTILDIYNIPYTFSDTLSMCLSLHKGYAKRIFSSLAIPTPKFKVVENIESIEKLYSLNLKYPLFAKPIAEGTSKGILNSRIENPEKLFKVCYDLLKRFKQPVLIEEYLPGREFTVGIIQENNQTKVLGVLEIVIKNKGKDNYYSYDLKSGPDFEDYFESNLVEDDVSKDCAALAVRAWDALNCKDAGRVDIRLDSKGNPQVMEVNPLAGLAPNFSDIVVLAQKQDINYSELIKMIIDSANSRIRTNKEYLNLICEENII